MRVRIIKNMQPLKFAPLALLLALAVAALPIGPLLAADQETIHGQIVSNDGAGNLQVNDDRGFVDNVQLQRDTVVNPGGAQLQPGAVVTIVGTPADSVFAAQRIDVADQPPPQGAPPLQSAPPPPGREVTGVLETPLDSKTAYVGQEVALGNVASADGRIRGATLNGTVTDVTRPGQGYNAQIRIHFDSMRRADGQRVPIDGVVESMQVQTKSNAAKEAGAALLGMLAGNALFQTLFGLSGGGVIGAVGGFLIAKDNRADIVIPANTAVTVQLLTPRRQAR